MIICGIDPGLGGAIARIDAASGAIIDIVDMPVLELIKAKKKSRVVDPYQLAEMLGRGCGHAFVEVQQTRPGQSAPAVAKTFTAYGMILGAIASLGIPVTHVNAQVWKKALRVPAAKDGARARASQLIPAAAGLWPLVKHDGRAEAALIALWGRRELNATMAA